MPPQYMLMNQGYELIYSIIILFLCILIYFKTKEVYDLTKHKGVKFFRYSFLFFGLAYASRPLIYSTIISTTSGNLMKQLRNILPLSNLIVAYFSTMAILYLTYSLVWKKYDTEHFLTIANITALIVGAIAFMFKSPFIVSIIQFLLLLITVIISIKNHQKKKTHTRTLYLLIAISWILNMFVLSPKNIIPKEFQTILQIVSIGLFIIIYYKVAKLIK